MEFLIVVCISRINFPTCREVSSNYNFPAKTSGWRSVECVSQHCCIHSYYMNLQAIGLWLQSAGSNYALLRAIKAQQMSAVGRDTYLMDVHMHRIAMYFPCVRTVIALASSEQMKIACELKAETYFSVSAVHLITHFRRFRLIAKHIGIRMYLITWVCRGKHCVKSV